MDTSFVYQLNTIKFTLLIQLISLLTKPTNAGLRIVVKHTASATAAADAANALFTNNYLLHKGGDDNSADGFHNDDNHDKTGLDYIYHTTCEYNGLTYATGEFHLEGDCITCNCNSTTGDVKCKAKDCPVISNCIVYEDLSYNNINKSVSVHQCCPKCLEYGCMYNGTAYKAGEKIRKSDCTKCYCPWEAREEGGGEPKCLTIQCNQPRCVDGVVPEGKCCPVCFNGPNCFLDSQVISEGERIYVDKCKYCYCKKETWTGESNYHPRQATCERSFFCL